MKRHFASLVCLGILSWTTASSAFCRTTICDPNVSCKEDPALCCIVDSSGCETNTPPISWPTNCVSYNVHEDGAPDLGIDPKTLSAILDDAFTGWLGVDCNGERVSLAIEYRGLSECGAPEYNLEKNDRNANVWMFNIGAKGASDDPNDSMLDAAALAVTTVSFSEETAQIYDADVELLSTEFTTGDSDVVVDLASVVTHEAGHFLGLDHSRDSGATMASGYTPGSIGPRTLTQDDVAGICATYPEDRDFPGGKTCDPRGKYSTKCDRQGCGCRMVGSPTPLGPWAPMVMLLLLARRARVRLRRPS